VCKLSSVIKNGARTVLQYLPWFSFAMNQPFLTNTFKDEHIIRGLLEKYPTFGREKETGLPEALDT